MSAREAGGSGAVCFVVDSLVEVFCWYPAEVANDVTAEFSVHVSNFTAAAVSQGIPAPRRFLSVHVTRDVWVLMDNGAIGVLFDSGGSWDYALPELPPNSWSAEWALSLGLVVASKPFIKVC